MQNRPQRRGEEAWALTERRPSGLLRGWAKAADWLGACKPLDLILGAVAMIAVIVALAELL